MKLSSLLAVILIGLMVLWITGFGNLFSVVR